MSRHQILTLGAPAPPRSAIDSLKDRIVTVIARGVKRFRMCPSDPIKWRRLPGAMPWWEVRQRVGGRVTTGDFTEAVESLMDEGKIIEVRLVRSGKKESSHLLVLPGRFQTLNQVVAQVRGRADVLEGEPWARAILATRTNPAD